MSYSDIYKLRLNRYGLDYQSRIQGEREKMFDLYLLKTLYRVTFTHEGQTYAGSLERYKQDETKTLHYLLTELEVMIPNGTILTFLGQEEGTRWMVYYLEGIEASGYNRYIMLKMTHFLTWRASDGTTQTSWAYFFGQENNMLKDELRSRSKMNAVYNENLKSSFFILPRNQHIKKDVYLIVGEAPFQEHYRVTGHDIQSTPGVEYVTIDPVYEYDLTPPPEKKQEDKDEDFFWFGGGA